MTIVERVITVHYLQPYMANDLLCKFPDASAFDFNYSESGIWSPLLPRGGGSSLRKVKGRMAMKKKKKVMNVVNKRLDFSPKPTPKRGWNSLLKAVASMRFKLQRRSAIKMTAHSMR